MADPTIHTVDLQALDAEFDKYFQLVLDGQTILITEEGQPLAEMGPPRVRQSEFESD